MEKPIVTIIVPVYKAEKYLSCCIDSILAQSFKDFELLLIDDGSPDSSGQICNEYAERDTRVCVFHKNNGGVSSARNLGLDNVQGEWVCFIDSDDWVEVNFLEELIQYNSFDLIVGGLDCFGCSTISTKRDENIIIDLSKRHEAVRTLNANDENTISTFYYSCGKLFRQSIISKYNFRFDTRMRMCEDTCFLMQYIIHSNMIVLTNSSLYRYRILSIPGKYKADYKEYKVHKDLFDIYLLGLESFLGGQMLILRRKIYSAILFQFFIFLKVTRKYSVFKQEVSAFNRGFTYSSLKEIHFGRTKRFLYYLVFKFPLLGYGLMRIIVLLKELKMISDVK